MGHQKKKKTKKGLDFFSVNCRFAQPYKVLLDGNFIHTALGFKTTDIEKRIADLLGATRGLRLHVTPCILYELTVLGPEYIETLKWASTHARLLQCGHVHQPVEPDVCINSLIGMDNPDQYHVATQDKQLRGSVGRVKAGPTLYISVNGFHLSRPSDTQRQLAGQVAVANMQPSELELSTDIMRQLPGLHSSLRTSARFKKKKAKGPNPLAVKAPKAAKKAKRLKTAALDMAAATAEAGATAAAERPPPQPEPEPSEQAAGDGAAPAEPRLTKKQRRLLEAAQETAKADPDHEASVEAKAPISPAQQGANGTAGNDAAADGRPDGAAGEQPTKKRLKPGKNLPKKPKEEKKRERREKRERLAKKRKAKKKKSGYDERYRIAA